MKCLLQLKRNPLHVCKPKTFSRSVLKQFNSCKFYLLIYLGWLAHPYQEQVFQDMTLAVVGTNSYLPGLDAQTQLICFKPRMEAANSSPCIQREVGGSEAGG